MVEAIISGALLGLLMASVFVSGGALIITQYITPDSSVIKFFNSRRRPTFVVLLLIGIIYMLWSVVGIIHGAAFVLIGKINSLNGLGSPNLIFTLLTLILPGFVILIIAYTKKPALLKTLPIILIFVGIFGWMMPYTLN
ncbi:MAG: hypothetical protein CL880_01575 [Dehalococcoidia bacterium]|nr:hypothetical protein [Dehalococcoidia bacterium]|tara:strand:+ start:2133 stop:2549 length:417 start_codon:yes stop_codon:yes gene_type:complete